MKIRILLIFTIITALCGPLSAASMYDPDLEWKSIKTRHFWIHYHQGLEKEAGKLAVIAERVHFKLAPQMKWEPYLRTDVVLIDNMYTANGFATPIPFNKVQIYLARPEPNSVLGNFDDWLEMVFTHEYTHILTMDMAHGFPAGVRNVFGRCCFPNALVPYWMAEGITVYNESANKTHGRNNSTYTDMILRMEIFSNSFKAISKASSITREWPVGNVPYLYGGLFLDYIEKKYGRGSMTRVYHENAENLLPFSDFILPYIIPFCRSSEEIVLDDSFDYLWDEWREFMKIKYDGQISKIRGEGVTEFTKITASGYNTALPRFSRDGKSLHYIRYTNYNMPALMTYSVKDGGTRELCRINDPNSISTTDDGAIFISDAEFYRTFSIYNEAYRFDLSYEKLTSKLRGSYIDISRDGESAVYIYNQENKYSIILSDKFFTAQKKLIADSVVQMSFTKLSPDEKRIAFTMKDEKGFADIAVMDIAGGAVTRLTEDAYNDIEPAWHPDGKRIIFSSDRNGVYNLYEYNLETKSISKITNMVGGAFSPDISPDGGTIAFSLYGSVGFDIALLKYPEKKLSTEKANQAVLPAAYFITENNKPDETGPLASEDYSVWNSIAPPFWVPLIGSTEVYDGKNQWALGFASPFILPANDTLVRHLYLFQFLGYTFEKRALIAADYAYTRFYPNFIFSYYNDTLTWGKDEFPWKGHNTESVRMETEKAGIAGISLPFLYFQSSHILSFSYEYSESHTDYYNAPSDKIYRYKVTEALVRMHYEYSCASLYSYSISPEDGRSFFLVTEVYDEKLQSDLSYTKIFSEYSEYLPGIWKNNVTMLRLRGGASFNNPDYKSPFNLGKFEKGKTAAAKADEDSFGLRGYPSGLIYGNVITTGTVEYKFPVLQVDLGYATIPLMFRDLWINIFAEAGNVWEDQMSYEEFKNDVKKTSYTELRNSKVSISDFKSSAGVELNMRITLGYVIDIQGYIGFARGFSDYGEDQVYFAISTIFEGAMKDNYKWLDYL